jgi:TPR repeat protein
MTKLLRPHCLLALLGWLLLCTQGFAMTKIDYTKLAFTCSREVDHVPKPSPEAEALFKQARALHVQALEGEVADRALLRKAIQGYDKAYQAGHWKGARNIALMASAGVMHQGEIINPPDHSLAKKYAKKLIEMNSATGYNLMAAYAYDGWAGVLRSEEAGLTYMRKAADLGLPQAQFKAGSRLLNIGRDTIPDEDRTKLHAIGRNMLACAVRQGLDEAAFRLATHYEIVQENYPYALFYSQQAGKMGHATSLFSLYEWFRDGENGYAKDAFRAQRYEYYFRKASKVGGGPFPNLDIELPLPPPPKGGSYPPPEMGWPNAWTNEEL